MKSKVLSNNYKNLNKLFKNYIKKEDNVSPALKQFIDSITGPLLLGNTINDLYFKLNSQDKLLVDKLAKEAKISIKEKFKQNKKIMLGSKIKQ